VTALSATTQISVSSISPTAITAQSYCSQIRVTENRGVVGWPTSDFLIRKPASGSTAVRLQAGAHYTFYSSTQEPAFFRPGEIAGYVQMVAGSTTFDQDEDFQR
jgi:hypothetical protein